MGGAGARRVLLAVAIGAACAGATVPGWASVPVGRDPIQVSGSSPFAGCSADEPDAQLGTNHPGSEVEPQVAVNPVVADADGDGVTTSQDLNIVTTFQQDRWSNSGSRGIVTGVSIDGGSTWDEVVPPGITKCAGGAWDRASNPWLSFGPGGELYHSALVFDRDKTTSDILVSRSDDGGRTWGRPASVVPDQTTRNDKPSITADPHRPGNAYLVWQRQSTMSTFFSRTTDGTSWETPRQISALQIMGAEIVVRPTGDLVLVGGALKGKGSTLVALRSSNAGASWSSAVSFATVTKAQVTDPESGHKVRTAGTFGMPDVAVDASPSSPGYGNLYAVWEDGRFSSRSKSRFSSIALSMSVDGGATWTAPVKVNQTPTSIPTGNQQAFTPSVTVSSSGAVAVSYYDLRENTTAAPLLTDRWLAHCHPTSRTSCGSATAWAHGEVRLTAASFDHSKAPEANGWFLGDYQGLTSAGDTVLALFAEAHAADPANVFFRSFRL